MNTTAEAPLKVPRMSSVDVIRLVYEQFRPVTKKCGPLLAGTVFFQGAEGKLYLTEYQYWLWSSAENTKELTHPEVNVITTPEALLRNLLACTAGKIRAFEAHLDRIEQRAEDVPSMIGYYLSNDAEIMTDLSQPPVSSAWKNQSNGSASRTPARPSNLRSSPDGYRSLYSQGVKRGTDSRRSPPVHFMFREQTAPWNP